VDGAGSAARFVGPRAVVAAPGTVWLTDGTAVRGVATSTAQVTTRASVKKPGFATVPTGIALAGGDLYVAARFVDKDDNALTGITKVSTTSGEVSDFPIPALRDATAATANAKGTALFVTGHGDFFPSLFREAVATATSSDLAPWNQTGLVDATGPAARFDFPADLASNGASLYAADNARIRKVVIATGAVSTVARGLDAFTSGVALSGGTLYVSDAHRVRAVVLGTGQVSTLARLGTTANDVTVAGGDLYVVGGDCALYRIPVATGTPSVFAGMPGACGSADGTGTAARFGADATCPACPPQGVASDGTNLYVADHLAIRKVALGSAVVTTLVPAGPPFDPQLDVTVAAGRVYVTRLSNIVAVPASGGAVTDVTRRGDDFDHLGYTPTRASATHAPEVSGITASPDGHQVFFTDRTGVGAVAD
jgi:hypothetical protein